MKAVKTDTHTVLCVEVRFPSRGDRERDAHVITELMGVLTQKAVPALGASGPLVVPDISAVVVASSIPGVEAQPRALGAKEVASGSDVSPDARGASGSIPPCPDRQTSTELPYSRLLEILAVNCGSAAHEAIPEPGPDVCGACRSSADKIWALWHPEQPGDLPANNRDAAMTPPILGGDHEAEPSSIPAQRTSPPAEAGASGDYLRSLVSEHFARQWWPVPDDLWNYSAQFRNVLTGEAVQAFRMKRAPNVILNRAQSFKDGDWFVDTASAHPFVVSHETFCNHHVLLFPPPLAPERKTSAHCAPCRDADNGPDYEGGAIVCPCSCHAIKQDESVLSRVRDLASSWRCALAVNETDSPRSIAMRKLVEELESALNG